MTAAGRSYDGGVERDWNPWTILRTTNPLFYLAYAASAIVLGFVALVTGVLGLLALPTVAQWISDLERGRVTLLGLRRIPRTPGRRPAGWLWMPGALDVRDLAGWTISVGFAVLDTVAALICLVAGMAAVSLLVSGRSPVWWLAGGLATAIAVALTLMAAAAVSGMQATAVQRALTPEPDLAAQVSELTTSRVHLVDDFESERRRIERDLHDGAQQFLVLSSLKVGEAALMLDAELAAAPGSAGLRRTRTLLAQAQDDADKALRSLRETVAGIHPKVLSDHGLAAAVSDLAGRQLSPVSLWLPDGLATLPPRQAATAYFLVAEAFTNVAKHAPGAPLEVRVEADGRALHVLVRDQGPGGAALTPGGGLAGLRERFVTQGGELRVSSPVGGPTVLVGVLPL